MLFLILLLQTGGFSSVFVNQSFWQTGIAAKPVHSVWGFIVGALVWFAIPLGGSYALGLGYWAVAISEKGGKHFVDEQDVELGEYSRLCSQGCSAVCSWRVT